MKSLFLRTTGAGDMGDHMICKHSPEVPAFTSNNHHIILTAHISSVPFLKECNKLGDHSSLARLNAYLREGHTRRGVGRRGIWVAVKDRPFTQTFSF